MYKPRTLVISDTHLKHQNMKTYCQRPEGFTDLIIKNWCNLVDPLDTVIHLGDVAIGKYEDWAWIIPSLPGKKILIRGNHDDNKSCDWWLRHGFDFVCDGMIYKGMWLTHKPSDFLPPGCVYNVFGHLHNVWHGFTPNGGLPEGVRKLKHKWQRLFALEYTNYKPVVFEEFLSHPDKYFARGINAENLSHYYKTGGK